jgi:hypothetical protein
MHATRLIFVGNDSDYATLYQFSFATTRANRRAPPDMFRIVESMNQQAL